MPFEIFRRHQRKLLAVFGIMAMFAFVLSDSLPRLLNANASPRDQKVVELYGKPVYQSQLNELARERNRANLFVSSLAQFMPRDIFGGLKTRDLVDAVILEREADRLGIPATPEMGREWLKTITQGRMNRELFEAMHSRFSNEVSEPQMLAEIANQVRLANVRRLRGSPLVTPYDVFRSYRDQNERVAAKLVEIPVDGFLSKVPEPSAAEVQALYEQYKDVLPEPTRDTPGFKIPRQVDVEILSIDGNSMARGIRDRLTESELTSYYENHKQEFEIPTELPRDLFADNPELTPPILQSFADIRGLLAPRLADEKAQGEINDKFNRIKDDVLIPFADHYLTALDELEEAKKTGSESKVRLPTSPDLKSIAQKEGLAYEDTGLISREQAERYGQISSAEVGTSRLTGGHRFAEEFFESKTGLYEPVELTDVLGTRFLVRKIKDVEPRVPPLDEVRSNVILAWKMAQAIPLAEKAANDLGASLKAKGGGDAIKDTKVDTYRVISVPPITRSQAGFMPANFFDPIPVAETQIPEVPNAGEPFREAYFGLQPGTTEVAANLPKTIYYVLALDRREPAKFDTLYSPNGDEFRYKGFAKDEAARKLDDQWMGWLRQQAGLKSDWLPPDEAKREESAKK